MASNINRVVDDRPNYENLSGLFEIYDDIDSEEESFLFSESYSHSFNLWDRVYREMEFEQRSLVFHQRELHVNINDGLVLRN